MTSNSDEYRLEKRRKIDESTSTSVNQHRQSNTSQFRWRTSAEHQSYSAKLIDALRQVQRRRNNAPPIFGRRAVRDAADKALAIAAKGRTRWSRAILTNQVKLRLKYHRKAKIRSKVPPLPLPSYTAAETSNPTAPIEKRVKLLSQLVPGCQKASFPELLDETTDYIAALQMQVRTMTALAQLLTGSMNIEPSSSNHNPVH